MRTISSIVAVALVATIVGCGSGETREAPPGTKPESMLKKEEPAGKDLGIGPVKKVDIPETIDEALAAKGKETFEAKCTACHKIGKRFVGPDLTGVVNRREPEWIMNMILNPEVMVKDNETAKALLAEYMSPMANQNLTEEEARSVLEYFRTLK
ncbi:MAG: c-type cytochrome [Flavobacteriales bacterium]|nr:c-type cytochrome [Flavobacteriales bacterium]